METQNGISPANGCYCGAGCKPERGDRHPLIHGERDVVAMNIHRFGGMLAWSDEAQASIVTDIDTLAKYDALDQLPQEEQAHAAQHGGKADPRRNEARAFCRDYTGHNSFVLDVKDKITPPRRGKLTSKMVDALLSVRDREAAAAKPLADPAAQAEREAIAAYLEAQAPSNGFMKSLLDGLRKYGSLTDKQLAAVRSNMERDQAQAELKSGPKQQVAKAAGEGFYRFRDEIYKVVQSRAGRLYAKRLQVEEGDEKGTWEYEPGIVTKLSADDALTLEEAQAFGQLYGICCVCAARLTNEESIELGIGPICRNRII